MSLIYKGKAKSFPAKARYISGGVEYNIEVDKPITPEPPPELRQKMLKIKGFCEEEVIEPPAIAKVEKAEKADKPKTTSKARGLAGGE